MPLCLPCLTVMQEDGGHPSPTKGCLSTLRKLSPPQKLSCPGRAQRGRLGKLTFSFSVLFR